ncbi:hypothetical protein NC99_03690 [Sunxiuqinia dokdonensis]|uniref:Uncharacterized protein n=1 Tax=Sunxiuqinia dokdonensis TaxID=1409788 RepID=A0A0L8VEL0_9BACT|nr:hypothetical protein NC99_03690 [Sunxiuqinia dokdonensis]
MEGVASWFQLLLFNFRLIFDLAVGIHIHFLPMNLSSQNTDGDFLFKSNVA